MGFFPLINFVSSLLIWACVTLVENKPAPGKKLNFPMLVLVLNYFFTFFFLGNTNFGLDGEFLSMLWGFTQVAICPSSADGLTL